MSSQPTTSFAAQLIARAHSPNTTQRLHQEKVRHKGLSVRPTTLKPASKPQPNALNGHSDAREARRALRQSKAEKRRSNKPKPLSAAEKRRLCIHDIPKEEAKWSIYAGLRPLWCKYVRGLLGLVPPEAEDGQGGRPRKTRITPAHDGKMLVCADFHGAEITCVRSSALGRVGVCGIVVKDTKFTFVVVTRKDQVKVLPKEGSVFRVELPLEDEGGDAKGGIEGDEKREEEGGEGLRKEKPKSLVFELYGEQLKNRAPERMRKTPKSHYWPDL